MKADILHHPSLTRRAALAGMLALALSRRADAESVPWTLGSPMKMPKDDFGTVLLNGLIYAIGGMTGPMGTVLDDVEVYDPQADTWTVLPSMPAGRRSVRAAAIDQVIYLVGGVDEEGATAEVVRFDPLTGDWATVAPMAAQRYGVGLTAVDGNLYAAGGFFDGNALTGLERYDPVTDRWDQLASMTTPRTHLALLPVGDVLCAIGGEAGQGSLDVVEIYDPASDTWTMVDPIPVPMSNFGSTAIGESIHLLWHDVHLHGDPRIGSYQQLPAMPTPRHGLGVAHVDGRLYAIGGCHRNLYDLNVVEITAV